MTDEISRLVEGLKLWRQSLKHDRESIIDEQLMRVNTLNQDMLSTVIAYIEAGEKEMPKMGVYPLYNAALDACAPIIARLVSERNALQAKLDAVMKMARVDNVRSIVDAWMKQMLNKGYQVIDVEDTDTLATAINSAILGEKGEK